MTRRPFDTTAASPGCRWSTSLHGGGGGGGVVVVVVPEERRGRSEHVPAGQVGGGGKGRRGGREHAPRGGEKERDGTGP